MCKKKFHWKKSLLLNSHSTAKRLGRAGASHEYSCWNCILNFSLILSRLAFSRHFSTGTRDITNTHSPSSREKFIQIFQDVWRCAWNNFFWLFKCRHHDLNEFFFSTFCMPVLWRDRHTESARGVEKCALRPMRTRDTVCRTRKALEDDEDNVGSNDLWNHGEEERKPTRENCLFILVSRWCIIVVDVVVCSIRDGEGGSVFFSSSGNSRAKAGLFVQIRICEKRQRW